MHASDVIRRSTHVVRIEPPDVILYIIQRRIDTDSAEHAVRREIKGTIRAADLFPLREPQPRSVISGSAPAGSPAQGKAFKLPPPDDLHVARFTASLVGLKPIGKKIGRWSWRER